VGPRQKSVIANIASDMAAIRIILRLITCYLDITYLHQSRFEAVNMATFSIEPKYASSWVTLLWLFPYLPLGFLFTVLLD